MSIESLKQQARRHEQNEEWKKALDQYNKALDELARDDQVDIGLYNRVGDLYVRVGDLDSAFQHYDKCVDLYREAYLPNNAIAVCKKIIRNMPERSDAYLRIGQIRAEQGFLPDARENFLTYAERMQQAGDIDESFRALIEFCDLAPDDIGVRVTVAENMAASGRTEEAVEQFIIARQQFSHRGDQAEADELEARIVELDPDADLSSVPAVVDAFAAGADEGDLTGEFGEISFGGSSMVEPDPDEAGFAARDPGFTRGSGFALDSEASDDDAGDGDTDHFDMEAAGDLPMRGLGGADDEEGGELPIIGFGDEEEEDAAELPVMELGDDAEEEAVELPTMSFDDDDEAEAVELPTMEFDGADDATDEDGGAALELEEAIEESASDFDFDVGPEPIEPAAEPRAEPASSERKPTAPTPSGSPPEGGYVDLGAMVLGGGEQKSTRLTIAYEEPSGDEEADFAKMLSQFKEKISENLDSSDVRAHYDLGTAYKEMGLLDEAISSFQAALRASSDHLPTYELMGQTFIEMGKPEAAVKSLRRALQTNSGVEDDLVGIYYYLARAYEALDDKPSAVEFYDRVFSLDINFADVTERLRELR